MPYTPYTDYITTIPIKQQAPYNGDRAIERRIKSIKKSKDLFDEKASEWSATRNIPSRGVPVQDALERGQVKGKRVVDLGAGTGLATQILRNKFENVIAVDISQEMIVNSVASRTSQICADGFILPFPNNSIDVFLAMNMILFPNEIERCLRNE